MPPKPPWVGFAEVLGTNGFAELTLFASFSGKRRIPPSEGFFWRPTPESALPRFWAPMASQNKRFLLLFLEKEEYHPTGVVFSRPAWSRFWVPMASPN
jgi:hypothetical protein